MASLSQPRLGNTGVSSLLKSAATIAGEINTFNDTQAQIRFENSAKTAEDLQSYQDYLNHRITNLSSTGSITDATKAANMGQTLITAIHGSASADIQRSTIAVLDGQGTNDQKLAAIGSAFQKLYAVGDLAAAQSYEQQYYSFYQTVQLQKQQAADSLASAAKSSSSQYQSLVTAAESTIKNNIQNANAAFAAQGPGFLDKQTNGYLKTQTSATGAKANGSASIFAALAGQVGMVNKGIQLNNGTKYAQGTYTPGSQLDIYTQAIIADPQHATSYQSKIDSYLNGASGIALPGQGNKSITYNALMNVVYAGNSGNAPYGVVRGSDGGYQVQAEHVTGYTFGKDQNGSTKLMPAYSFFNTPIPPNTQKTLEKAGINVKSDSNGDWWFQATTTSSFLGKELGNYPVQGAVQKDGKVEFITNDGKLLQMVEGQNGKFGLQQVNQFGQVINANVAGEYGFQPPAGQTNVLKGSTAFMSKVLGDSATPEEIGNKTVYQSNGKLYQLVSDTKGLKGLQEIDKNGKVLNNNVAGQYGFNPNSTTRLTNKNNDGRNPDIKGQQFMQSLLAQHQAFMSGMANAGNPNFHNPDHIHALSADWMGISNLISNAQIMQTVNQAHNQAMIALAAPIALPSISLPVPHAPAPVSVPQVKPLNVAAAQNANGNPQQAAGGFQSGNTQGINQAPGKGIAITGTTNAPVGMKL